MSENREVLLEISQVRIT
jgi:hypothetical protein